MCVYYLYPDSYTYGFGTVSLKYEYIRQGKYRKMQ